MKRGGVVYIMASNNRRVLYTGVTSDLISRVLQHKEKTFPKSFTAKYNCCILVYYYKSFTTIDQAIAEEKRIKGGNRKAKELLIFSLNREWRDLWEEVKKW